MKKEYRIALKAQRVIHSCRTPRQAIAAERYIRLAMSRVEPFHMAILGYEMNVKWIEILGERK